MPDMWIDVDTAVTVPVNVLPLTDDTDFKTRETAIVYNQAGMDLVWNFQTAAGVTTQTAVTPTTAGVYDWTHSGDGMYKIEIPASGGASINNDAEGFGWFTGICTGVLAWRGPVVGFRAAGLNALLVDDAFSSTRALSGTALPDAAADAAGGLPISDAGGLDIDAIKTKTDYLPSATAGAAGGVFIAGTNAATTVTTSFTTTFTGNLTGSVNSVTGGVTLASTQPAITWGSQTISVTGSTPNLIFAGSGSGDVFSFTRSGAGNLMDTAYSADFQAEVNAAADLAISDADIATETKQDTVLTRIGSFTGSGVNTVLGFFQSLMRSDASNPSDVGGTYDAASDSNQAIKDNAGVNGAGYTDLGGMSTGMKAEIESECNDALVALHLDHLFAVDYDPASKPGAATALLNELVGDDSGISQFTANALELAPGGGAVTLAASQPNYAPAKAGDNMGSVSSVTGSVGGSVAGSVASVTGAVGSVTAAVTITGTPDVNVAKINDVTITGDGKVTPFDVP